MRTVEEIKKDIENYKINKRPNDGSEIEVYALQKELCHTLIGKIPLDRLEEICNAEREGRCVVMPCKVGDKVYIITKVSAKEAKIMGIPESDQSMRRRKKYPNTYNHWRPQYFPFTVKETVMKKTYFKNIGKTVFPTREEAEKALKEREQK